MDKPKIIIRENDHDSTIISRALNILRVYDSNALNEFLGDLKTSKNVKRILEKYFTIKIKERKKDENKRF